MARYNKVTPELIDELMALLGKHNMTVDPEKLQTYQTDEEANPIYFHTPEVVVFPETTEQVAAIMKMANKYLVPVTPRGGGSSLCCGAIPVKGGIVIVMDKMNKILEINEDALYVQVQAGVVTNDLQKEVNAHGLLYAGDPSSRDSSQIGGNVATNAGGSRVIKYGTTRDQVYEIEIVTPTGEITTVGKRLAKNTTGYALEKLIAGSEGTLAIVTGLTLKLKPLAPCRFDMLEIFHDQDQALSIPHKLIKAGVSPAQLEFLDTRGIRSCERYLKSKLPHSDEEVYYIIVTIDGFDQDAVDNESATVDEICTEAGAFESLVADERIWSARRNIGEAARNDSLVFIAEDICVPVDKIADLMHKLPEIEQKFGIATTTSAHIGDGNIHVNALQMDVPDEEWNKIVPQYHEALYSFVYSLGGCLSGEHGIGAKKIKEMKTFSDPIQLEMMKSIKKALDPNLILNPGKIFEYED